MFSDSKDIFMIVVTHVDEIQLTIFGNHRWLPLVAYGHPAACQADIQGFLENYDQPILANSDAFSLKNL